MGGPKLQSHVCAFVAANRQAHHGTIYRPDASSFTAAKVCAHSASIVRSSSRADSATKPSPVDKPYFFANSFPHRVSVSATVLATDNVTKPRAIKYSYARAYSGASPYTHGIPIVNPNSQPERNVDTHVGHWKAYPDPKPTALRLTNAATNPCSHGGASSRAVASSVAATILAAYACTQPSAISCADVGPITSA